MWVNASSSGRYAPPARCERASAAYPRAAFAGFLECPGLRHPDECPVERAAGERVADDRALAGGEDERKRGRPFPQVVAGELPGLDRRARAVEDVVGDLERNSEGEAEATEGLVAASQQARGAEELRGLQRAAPQVLLHGRVRPVGLRVLERLALHQRERRAGQELNALGVAGRGELRERAGEEVVAGRAGADRAVGPPRRLAPAPQSGAIDEVVVDEARHVDKLDGDAGREWVSSLRGGQEDEQGPKPLTAGGERRGTGLRDRSGVAGDRLPQTLFQLLQVAVEPGRRPDSRKRAHRASPIRSTTIPPASSRWPTGWKPAARTRSPSSVGPMNRRTLAGR